MLFWKTQNSLESVKCYTLHSAALTMETCNISPRLSWAGAYAPSLFQHSFTSFSGEGINWRNTKKKNKTKQFKQGLFKFNVSCKIDYSASERKSVNAEFFFIELAFVLTKFSLLHLSKNRETFHTFLSSKKLTINNWVVLIVQCQIISQMLVLKMIFQKSISYTYIIV